MYEVNDYVVYGTRGVCRVVDVGTIDTPGIPKNTVYYTLNPYYTKGSKIFIPADNIKTIIRPILSKEEALKLIDDIVNIDSMWILDDKSREINYKEALRSCNCRELIKIIKSIYLRKKSRLSEGKKISSVDAKYFKLAEDSLYGELAIPLEMDIDSVKDFIIKRIEQLVAPKE